MDSLLNTSLLMTLSLIFFTTTPFFAQPVAPASIASPNNITAILEAGGQYTTFIHLLTSTPVNMWLTSTLNNSFNGLTLIAPTDNAFNKLKAGTLNKLTEQELTEVVSFHVLSRFFTTAMFHTVINPVNTLAYGVDTLNITSSNNQVNISTGVVDASITSTLTSSFPLAAYSTNAVLLPYSIFGVKPPAPAPAPAPASKRTKSGNKSHHQSIAKPPSSSNSPAPAPARPCNGLLLLGYRG